MAIPPYSINLFESNLGGNTWYVSTTGSDSSGAGSQGNPFATIQGGINSASDGDMVSVAAGMYMENIDFNKKNMSIVLPDLSVLNKNQNASLQQKYGCQLTCMSYQNLDTNLAYYLNFFANSAFVLKPASLRFIPVTFTTPPPQDPQLSYAPRKIDMPQFSGNI